MAEYSKDDGMEGGADPCGSQGGGPDVKLGSYDGDGDGGGPDYAGAGSAPPGDVSPPAGSSTASQPRPEGWIK